MKKFLLVALVVVCLAVAFLTFNGGHFGGVYLPWAKRGASDNAIITYSIPDGFVPASITVNSGDTVEIRNLSTDRVDVESFVLSADQSNTDRELNLGAIEPSTHKDFTVTNKGTFRYYNDLNQSETATITIK